MGFAFAGGVFLFLGNLGTQYGLAFTGLSITEVVSSSITVVGGTTINYFLDDRCDTSPVLVSSLHARLQAHSSHAFSRPNLVVHS